ncbi:hypothetical protein ACFSCX_23460 [Bacillus salitolerans]|uniref:Uncharacterized protein n=1 Tax=Bacillus salitolerans TaxID=1437434 RepID=A0ABW4LWH9_9BACI
MNVTELKNMRLKQIVFMNVMIVTVSIIYFIVIRTFGATQAQVFVILGIILLCQAVYGLGKGNSTKSFIPIFEKVAIYEREKMGKEWDKQRKTSSIMNLFLGALMFFQAFINRDSDAYFHQIEVGFILFFGFMIVALVNIGLFIHIRKVDRSHSIEELKGYTRKLWIQAFILGFLFTIVLLAVTFTYIFSL